MALGILAAVSFIANCDMGAAEVPQKSQYSVRVYGLASDGATVPDTPTPAPTATVTPVPTAQPVVSDGCYRSVIDDYFPAWALDEALSVVFHESTCNPYAVNESSGACGLFQIHPCPHHLAWWDPAVNASLAYPKWVDGGQSFWKHWYRWW